MAAQYWRRWPGCSSPTTGTSGPGTSWPSSRAEELETRIQERRAFVIDQLQRADAALEAGRPNEAVAIRAMLSEKYGQYTDLADLLGPPPGPDRRSPQPGPIRPRHLPRPSCRTGSASAPAEPEPAPKPAEPSNPPGDR